jgi:hypothetical protein
MKALFLIATSLALAACSDGPSVQPPPPAPVLHVHGYATYTCYDPQLRTGERVEIFDLQGTKAYVHPTRDGGPTVVEVPRSCLTPLN